MSAPFQGWVEIDLDALDSNVAALQRQAGRARLAAVVKANAYGHGALAVAHAALAAGADRVCTYNLDEAAELRALGFAGPILVLGPVFADDAERAVGLDVALTLGRADTARAVSEAARARGREVAVHVKVETGLNRLGLPPREALAFTQTVRSTPGLALEGFYTHFPSADGPDPAAAADTEERFVRFLALAKLADAPIRHASNTAALVRFPHMALDLVRVGIGLYGISPGAAPDDAFSARALGLRPVLSWKAMLVRVHDVPAGESVSYGGTWTAARDSRVGVVAVGYADGFRRSLGNTASMLLRGRRVPVVGTVCMDMCMLDLTDVPDADVGDEAIIVGADAGEAITLEDLARLCDTIPHEVSTGIGDRPARVYTRAGLPVAVQTKIDRAPVATSAATARDAVVAAGGR